jgi:Arc/MetJ-type ribon-helix-helix transcriptional regulator
MNIPLPKDLEDLIRRKVESKDYLSAAHVIEEALTLLEERDEMAVIRQSRLVQRLAYAVSQANSRQLIGHAEVFDGLARKSSALE